MIEWTPRFNKFLKKYLQARKVATDYSDGYIPGTKTVRIPHIGDSFSASSIGTTNGEVTATNVSDTKTDLTLDKWEGTSYVMTKYEATVVKDSNRLKNEYADAMGYALADKVDSDMLGQISSLDTSVGQTATAILSTQLEKAIAVQTSNSVPKEGSAFVLHPNTYWKSVMSVQKYYDASQFGKPSVPQGFHDVLYGMPVLLSHNVPTGAAAAGTPRYGALINNKALAYALRDVEIENKIGEHLRVKPTADVIYGYKLLNSGRGVIIRSND